MVQASKVKERHSDLKDALIQTPHVAPLGTPQQLERLVLLEVFAAVELLDAFQQKRRRSLVAGGHALS